MSVFDAGENRRPSGYFFLTPVWGESYTKLYIDTVIPSQLASGNLPIFRGAENCRYIIYTRPPDAERIRASAVYEPLNACVPVTFEFITDKVNVVHDMMTDCFRRGIRAAEEVDVAVLFLTPDIVLSDGAFGTVKRLADAGYDVVYVPAIRTMKTAVAARLEESYRRGSSIQISPAQLMRIALDNLHPLGDSSWWEEGEGGLIPANIYWRVDDEGLVGRCFHLHPILVHPQRKNATFFGTVDDDYVPAACPNSSRDYVVTDSDELLAIELSDPGRFFEMRSAKGSVDDAARWAEQFANARHRSLFRATIRMHTGISHPAKWTQAEERARLVAQEIENRLNRPAWRLTFNADLLIHRFLRWGKEYRLRFANREAAGPSDGHLSALTNAILSMIERLAGARAGLIKLMRRVADRMENLAARPYQAKVYRDLVDMLPPVPDLVAVANSPGRFYLAPPLSRFSPSFSGNRYVSVLRRSGVSILENGEHIPDSSKAAVVLEINAYRTTEIQTYLDESRRLLKDRGRLVVYLHWLAGAGPSGARSPMAAGEVITSLGSEFTVVTTKQQGGLGSYVRVKLINWLHGAINRRLGLRWLLLIFGLPLLPIVVIFGGIFMTVTIVLDFFDRSGRFCISSLTLAQKSPQD